MDQTNRLLETTPLYRLLSDLIAQRANCIKSNNTLWRDRCESRIEQLVKNELPSGSGWDNGTKLDLERSTGQKLVLYGGYHHMNDVGYYDGWTHHTITVRPTFQGTDITISGRNRRDIKEYLHSLFECALHAQVTLYFDYDKASQTPAV